MQGRLIHPRLGVWATVPCTGTERRWRTSCRRRSHIAPRGKAVRPAAPASRSRRGARAVRARSAVVANLTVTRRDLNPVSAVKPTRRSRFVSVHLGPSHFRWPAAGDVLHLQASDAKYRWTSGLSWN